MTISVTTKIRYYIEVVLSRLVPRQSSNLSTVPVNRKSVFFLSETHTKMENF